MNNTMNNINDISNYDNNGAIIYTIVTLLFYSLSLFCSLILNIDPDHHYDEQEWSVGQNNENKRISHSSQADILNILSDGSLREKYWRIYYGNDEFDCLSNKFVSAELKRLSIVSQRMKKLNNEQIKQSSKHKELNEFNRMITNPSSDLSSSPLLFKFRRFRSTSIPNASHSNYSIHRSFDILCETPLCKPPTITFTKHS